MSDWLTESLRTETTRVGAAAVLNKERSVTTTIRARAWMERCVARIRTRVPCLRRDIGANQHSSPRIFHIPRGRTSSENPAAMIASFDGWTPHYTVVTVRVLVLCHCYRQSGDVIRIISARKADQDEIDQYHWWQR